MSDLFQTFQTLEDSVSAGRIGPPKFLRCISSGLETSQIHSVLCQTIDDTSKLFGSAPTLAHLVGEGTEHLTALAKWPGGQSALISISATGDPDLDIMVLGSKGALYREGLRTKDIQDLELPRPSTTPYTGADSPVYGVLLIGGRRTHLEGYALQFRDDPRCRLIAVADESDVAETRANLNRLLANDLGLPYIPALQEALALDGIDIVCICPEVERRGHIAAQCAKAGKHLYLDKPLAATLDDAQAILEAVESSGVTAQMFTNIHSPWAQAAKQAVDQGMVGDLIAVHADCLFAKGPAGTVPEGFVRQESEGLQRYTFVEAKSELFDIGVYSLALVHWLTGRQAIQVSGITGNYFFKEHVACGIEDFGALALTLEGGITATVTGGRIGWMSHPAKGPQRAVLVGTNGTLVFDANQRRLEVSASEPSFTSPPIHPLDPMGMWGSTQQEIHAPAKNRWLSIGDPLERNNNDISVFLDCLDNRVEPEITAAVAATLLEVTLAGYASASYEKMISLPFTP